MSFESEIWETFQGVDLKSYIKKNHGGGEYVPWARIWAEVMKLYPKSTYEFEEKIVGANDDHTVEVICALTIIGNTTRPSRATREMWLPVMESFGQFLAIKNPSSREISDAKMRCLVKTAAMFGLGLNLWSGEDYQDDGGMIKILAFAKRKSAERVELWRTAIAIKDAYKEEDETTAIEAWIECSEDEMRDLWLAETKGGFFTMKEKEWIRTLRSTPGEFDNDV